MSCHVEILRLRRFAIFRLFLLIIVDGSTSHHYWKKPRHGWIVMADLVDGLARPPFI